MEEHTENNNIEKFIQEYFQFASSSNMFMKKDKFNEKDARKSFMFIFKLLKKNNYIRYVRLTSEINTNTFLDIVSITGAFANFINIQQISNHEQWTRTKIMICIMEYCNKKKLIHNKCTIKYDQDLFELFELQELFELKTYELSYFIRKYCFIR
jgi:hypothetical protein